MLGRHYLATLLLALSLIGCGYSTFGRCVNMENQHDGSVPSKSMQVMDHPLTAVPLLNSEQQGVLARQWIVTVEQLVSACATPAGREAMAVLLAIGDEEFEALLASLARMIGEERFRQLLTPIPGGELGLLLEKPEGDASAAPKKEVAEDE